MEYGGEKEGTGIRNASFNASMIRGRTVGALSRRRDGGDDAKCVPGERDAAVKDENTSRYAGRRRSDACGGGGAGRSEK